MDEAPLTEPEIYAQTAHIIRERQRIPHALAKRRP
jgi:hypothetical protein